MTVDGDPRLEAYGGDPVPHLTEPGLRHACDLSSYNTVTDWDALARAVDAVWIKAGQGSSLRPPYEDRACASHCAGARGRVSFGLYHYLMPRPSDAAQQAEDLVRVWERERPTEPTWLDVEEAADPLVELEAIGAWLGRYEDLTGERPWIYSYPYHLAPLARTGPLALADWPLVVAEYGVSGRPAAVPAAPAPWERWRAWQWAGGRAVPGTVQGRLGRLPGVTGEVDRVIVRGSDVA